MNPVAPIPNPNYQGQQDTQAARDVEHLNLLSIFYYVMAGLTALAGLAFLFQVLMGLLIAGSAIGPTSTITVSPSTFPGAPAAPTVTTVPQLGPSASFGWLFVILGVMGLVAIETLAYFTFRAGRSLVRREKKTLIQVVAAILCLNFPFGTALGVFTFVVLGRPSVEALFEGPRSS